MNVLLVRSAPKFYPLALSIRRLRPRIPALYNTQIFRGMICAYRRRSRTWNLKHGRQTRKLNVDMVIDHPSSLLPLSLMSNTNSTLPIAFAGHRSRRRRLWKPPGSPWESRLLTAAMSWKPRIAAILPGDIRQSFFGPILDTFEVDESTYIVRLLVVQENLA